MIYLGIRTDLSPGCSPLASLSSADMDSVVKECKWRLGKIQDPQDLERAALVELQFCTYVCSLPPSFSLFVPGRGSQLGSFVLMGNPIIREIPDTYFCLSRTLPAAESHGMKGCSQAVICASSGAGSVLEMLFYLSQWSYGNLHLQIPAQGIAETGSSLCKDFMVLLVD